MGLKRNKKRLVMSENKKDMFDSAVVKLDFLSKSEVDFKKAIDDLDKRMDDDSARISVANFAADKSKNSK